MPFCFGMKALEEKEQSQVKKTIIFCDKLLLYKPTGCKENYGILRITTEMKK